MAIHITRHGTAEVRDSPEAPLIKSESAIKNRVPSLNVDTKLAPSAKALDKAATEIIRQLVQQEVSIQMPLMLQNLRKALKTYEDETLTDIQSVIAQAKKRFEASIEEMIAADLLPNLTREQVSEIADMLGHTKESQQRKELALQTLQNLQETALLEKQSEDLKRASWEDSAYTSQEATKVLCELVAKYLPVNTEEAKQSSLQESEDFLSQEKYSRNESKIMASNKDNYLKNTPIYRAVLLFRAVKIDCDSKALCATCPFRQKGEECQMWKQAFALQDIAFYRAQAVSESHHENITAQKLAEAQIEIASLRQQLLDEQTKSLSIQDKLTKITSGAKHLAAAQINSSGVEDYETELDPYLKFR